MAKPFPTDHSIMKLAVAAEQHRKMNMASSSSVLTNPTVVIKKEEIQRQPVIESINSKPSPYSYQGANLITHHKAGSKRKKEAAGIEPVKLAPNPFNMTARNFPKRKHLLKNTSGFLNRTRGNNSSPIKALEQVRAALQPSLNMEIERVLHSYQEMFQMAAYNVGDNLKEPITAVHIGQILRRSLEEAKNLFKIEGDIPIGKSPDKKEKWTSARSVIIKKKKAKREEKMDKNMADNFDYPKWEDVNLTEETEFILGVKANKILGFASARGRLYIRHPQLFKYMGDQDDKQWLYDNGHMTMSGGKGSCQWFLLVLGKFTDTEKYKENNEHFLQCKNPSTDYDLHVFLMLAEHIRLLAVTHPDYKDNLGIKGEDVKGFTVPESVLKKMKLTLKRQTLIQEVRRESVDI